MDLLPAAEELDGGIDDVDGPGRATHIEFGADSFCDEVLAEYGKTFRFADIVQSTRLARAARVHCSHFVMCGARGKDWRRCRPASRTRDT